MRLHVPYSLFTASFKLILALALCTVALPGRALGSSVESPTGPNARALSEYNINLGSKYGVNQGSSVSHETLQAIMTGAGKGNRDNIYFLGLLKLYGVGLAQSDTAAIDYFRQAAELGLPDAQTALGVMMLRGQGVPQDFNKAEHYFRMAVAQDDTNGMWLLAKLLIDGYTTLGGSKLTEAVGLLKKAADRHSPQAEHYLALMYEYGRGIKQDLKEAAKYYKRAAEQQNVESIYNLAMMHAFGRGISQDFKQAIGLLQQGVLFGHAPSIYYMGVIKSQGHGTPVNYEEALSYFERAASIDDYRVQEIAAGSYADLSAFLAEAKEVNDKVIDEYTKRNLEF